MNTTNQNTERKYYIDNIRWLFILILIPFHAAMAWNSWGEGNYIKLGESVALSGIIYAICPWYMPGLFLIAGMSAQFSLRKRSYKQFAKERLFKLFVPLVIGLVTAVAMMAYLADRFNNGYVGNFFMHYSVFFTKFTDLTGYDGGFTPAHLWFLLYLFIVSMLATPLGFLIKKLFSRLNPSYQSKNLNILVILLLGVLPVIFEPVLNFAGKSIGSYFALYILGYFFADSETIESTLKKYRIFFLFLLVLLTPFNIYCNLINTNFSDALRTSVYNATSWIGILFWLGNAPVFFNMNNKVTQYLSKTSFLFYICHFMWLILFQHWFSLVIINLAALYLLPIPCAYIATFATVEIIRRIPRIRYLVKCK